MSLNGNGNGKIPIIDGDLRAESKFDKSRRELQEAFDEKDLNPRRFASALDDAYRATKFVTFGFGKYSEIKEFPDHKMRLRAASMHAAWDPRFPQKLRELFDSTPEWNDIELRFDQLTEGLRK